MGEWTFAKVPFEIITDTRVSDGATRLYSYLAFRQGSKETCWPSVAKMAHDLGKHRKTIHVYLNELEQNGYIKRIARKQRSSVYSTCNVDVTSEPTCNTGVTSRCNKNVTQNENHINENIIPTPSVIPSGAEKPLAKVRKKKETSAEDKELLVKAKELVAEYRKLLGYNLPSWGREISAAKWMIQAGFSVRQVLDCWRDVSSESFWDDKHCSLGTIQNKIGKWVENSEGTKRVIVSDTRGSYRNGSQKSYR